jgi:hypothetical protein
MVKIKFSGKRPPEFYFSENPFDTTEEIPAWVQSRLFQSEYEAGLYGFVYLLLAKMGDPNPNNVDWTFRMIVRLLRIKSAWAE